MTSISSIPPLARRLHRGSTDKSVREVPTCTRSRRKPGIIPSPNPASPPAADPPARGEQQPFLSFSELLDDAGGAPPAPAKDVCERPQAAQTGQPAATGDTQQQPAQQPANSEPTRQSAVVASALPRDETEKTDTTSAEGIAAASPDAQTDAAKASGDAANDGDRPGECSASHTRTTGSCCRHCTGDAGRNATSPEQRPPLWSLRQRHLQNHHPQPENQSPRYHGAGVPVGNAART